MVGCIALKPIRPCKGLLFNRYVQAGLTDHLHFQLQNKPFVFNSTFGVFVFFDGRESDYMVKTIIDEYFGEHKTERLRDIKVFTRHDSLEGIFQNILKSEGLSALGWKRLISSLLLQIDPYHNTTGGIGIKVYEAFRDLINNCGTKHQKIYFQHRLKMLGERVKIPSIDRLLHGNS